MMSKQPANSIIIVGAGFIGLCCAAFLKKHNIPFLILELAKDEANFITDQRAFALSLSSLEILKNLGLLEKIQSVTKPIVNLNIIKYQQEILSLNGRLIKETQIGAMLLASRLHKILLSEVGKEHIIYNTRINAIQKLPQNPIWSIHTEDNLHFTANFLIAADGTNSIVRQLLGLQIIIDKPTYNIQVASLALNKPLTNQAYEFMLAKNHTMALLPLPEASDYYAKLIAIKSLELNNFNKLNQILAIIGYQATITQQTHYLLQPSQLFYPAMPGAIFIGNAANTLLPVGAQGLNLGLRDVDIFIKLYLAYGNNCVNQYATARYHDVIETQALINNILANHNMYNIPNVLKTGSGWHAWNN